MNLVPSRVFQNKLVVYGVLTLVTILFYLKCIFFNFTLFDEQWLIINRAPVLNDWGNAAHLFKENVLGMFYRPLLILSIMLDYKLAGLDTRMYHFTNLFLHLLCVISFYNLLQILGSDTKKAFLLSLLFALHPMVVHAVAWIPGRNDTILCFFSLHAIGFLILFLKKRKNIWALLHFISFGSALLTKENAIVLPIVFLIFWFAYCEVSKKFFLFGLLWVLTGLMWYIIKSRFVTNHVHGPSSLLEIKNFFEASLIYAGKVVFPLKQSIMPTIKNSNYYFGIPAIILLVLIYYKFGVGNRKIATGGLGLGIGMLVIPVWFGVSSSQGELYEHRIYTSLTGLIIFISQIKFNYSSLLVKGTLLLVTLIFGIKSFIRLDVYKTSFSYTEDAVIDFPDNYILHVQKGFLFSNSGNYKAAIGCYTEALKLQPNKQMILLKRGQAYVEVGQKDLALADFDAALQIGYKPDILKARYMAYLKFGEIDKAQTDRENLRNYYGIDISGLTKTELNKYSQDKLSQINNMISRDSTNAILYVNRAKIYMDLRMGHEALEDLKKACELDPSNSEFRAYYNELNSSFPH